MANALRYQVDSLPDSGDPLLRVLAGGDLGHAIRDSCAHLLRALVTYTPGSAGLAVRYVFTPSPSAAMQHSRLAIVLIASALEDRVADNLRVLVECSDLTTLFGLKPAEPAVGLGTQYRAGCDVARVERAIQSLHPQTSNPAIPPAYYLCYPFVPRANNDYLLLDRVLDRVGEPVMFEVSVEPVDLSKEQLIHTRDLARLQSINRTHDLDDEDDLLSSDPFDAPTYSRAQTVQVVKPFRRRDPIADDVLRERRRLHEQFGRPHLYFHLRVLAQTPAVAQLVASAVAESAFEDGSYRLWPWESHDDHFRRMLAAIERGRVYAPSTLESVFGCHASAYRDFERFGHVATVDELLGAFTIPMAGRSQLRCLRKNTDPPHVPAEQLVILGHDD